MIYDIVFEKCPWHIRVALFDEAGKLLTVHFDDENRKHVEGAVVYGRVRKILPGLNAAFVDIGDLEDGFLPLKTIPKNMGEITEGQKIMVRVVSARREGKGARLDARVIEDAPNTNDVPVFIKNPPSALSRSLQDAGQTPVRVWIIDDRTFGEVAELVPEDKIFNLQKYPDVDILEKLDEQLEHLADGEFTIPGGGRFIVEITKALTAVDVDSSSFKGSGKEPLQLELNIYAAHEIMRVIRLLDISGNIIIDFLTMPKKEHRIKVRSCLINLFELQDLRKVEVLEMSRFGLVEINRERSGENLIRLLNQPLFAAGSALLNIWRQPKSHSYLIECSKEIADILNGRLTSSACLAYLGKPITVTIRDDLSVASYRVSSN